MAKTVFSGDMVFHVWANQSAPYGRRSDSRVSFDGRAIYSYGRHYMLGYVMPDGVTLLNSDKNSISTAKHKSQTLRAVRGTYYHLPHLTDLAHSYGFTSEDIGTRLPNIERYLRQNWEALTDDAAVYLLRYAGHRNPAAHWAGMRADCEHKARRAAEKIEREHNTLLVQKAKRMAGYVWADVVRDVEARAIETRKVYVKRAENWSKQWQDSTPSENLKGWRDDIRAMRAACKALPVLAGKRAPAFLTKVNRLVLATAKRATADFERFAARAQWAGHKATFRSTFRDVQSGTYDNGTTRAARQSLEWMSDHGRRLINGEKVVAVLRYLDDQESAHNRRVNAERMAREQEDREKWLAGGGRMTSRYSDENGRALLRVVGDELQTSWGAVVPLPHAIKAFRMVKWCRMTGHTWKRNGSTLRVGHFQIDSIDSSGNFKAGCHDIGWNEVERIAKTIGVFDQTAEVTVEKSH